MKDYFYGETVQHEEDQTGKRFYQFRVGALLAALFLLLTACATAEQQTKVCFLKMIGATEDGMSVVAQHCMTPEAFAESQK